MIAQCDGCWRTESARREEREAPIGGTFIRWFLPEGWFERGDGHVVCSAVCNGNVSAMYPKAKAT